MPPERAITPSGTPSSTNNLRLVIYNTNTGVIKGYWDGTITWGTVASGDTALVTESTTALNPDSTRGTGTTTEGASANIYRTVGTVTADAQIVVREHGVFSQAATGGGTLLDRTVFTTITLESGDSLQATYELTCSAGG
jgi:hypothetical protein